MPGPCVVIMLDRRICRRSLPEPGTPVGLTRGEPARQYLASMPVLHQRFGPPVRHERGARAITSGRWIRSRRSRARLVELVHHRMVVAHQRDDQLRVRIPVLDHETGPDVDEQTMSSPR